MGRENRNVSLRRMDAGSVTFSKEISHQCKLVDLAALAVADSALDEIFQNFNLRSLRIGSSLE
jgi:hypothetical protein